MSKFYCKTHDVEVEIIGNKKKIKVEYGKSPRCYLLMTKANEITTGKHGVCDIVGE